MKRFLKNNSLSIVVFLLFFVFLAGQSIAGYLNANEELEEHNQLAQSYVQYLGSGDFIESVFENWESEFLQMGAYVILTVYLFQKGSAESKKLQGEEPEDREPRKGGFTKKLYENSLSLAFLVLFVMSFVLHAYGGAQAACEVNQQHGQPCVSTVQFMGSSEFWFQSLQNWQSEFLAVFAIVVLSIFLRQKGSPESKPVSAPHDETGA